jgi:hypothetical protein
VQPWQDDVMWHIVASELRDLRRQGLRRLLTEETVRFATVKALVGAGVDPQLLRYEWPHPALHGSRIDLVLGTPPRTLFELKYPREPNEKNAAWTMIYGEVLKDFYRLAAYPYEAERIFVYAESDRLHKYMAGAIGKYGLDVHAEEINLHPEQAANVPATVATVFGPTLATNTVTARRIAAIDVDASLGLFVFAVDPLGSDNTAGPSAFVPAKSSVVTTETSGFTTFDSNRASGARAEILAAIDAIVTRSGGETFEFNDVLVEMRLRGSTYADSTVRTMVTSHMCANAPDHLAKTFDDLERVGRGLYQRRR